MQIPTAEQPAASTTRQEGFYVQEDAEGIHLKHESLERVKGWLGRTYPDREMAEKHAAYLRERCTWYC